VKRNLYLTDPNMDRERIRVWDEVKSNLKVVFEVQNGGQPSYRKKRMEMRWP
jgi:hypothetical protein